MASSSSSSRKRSDLIERTRYQNPLPRPPFPPKLLNIPTPADRFADPAWASRLADSVPFPLVVDGEGGIPLDLNRFPELWDVQQQQVQSHPVQDNLDPEDAWLLSPALASAPPPQIATPAVLRSGKRKTQRTGNDADDDQDDQDASAIPTPSGTQTPLAPGAITAKDVAWLRRTEYIGADRKAKAEAAIRARPAQASTKDTSPTAEIARIEATFNDVQSADLASLRHPTKKDIRPVESYDLLPDYDTWATEMHVLKFSDPPGRHGASHDARLALSLLRARKDPLTSRPMMSYYLPQTIAPEMTPAEFDELLLADPDAFDDEDRDFFKDQAGQLDDAVRESAILRREEMRRRRGWVGELPSEPDEGDFADDDEALQAAHLNYITRRAQVTTPYRHQRDYDVEKQGGEEEWQRVLVLNFSDGDGNAPATTTPLLDAERAHLIANHPSPTRVVHYHPIAQRLTLRVKRAARGGARRGDDEHWSNVALSHAGVTPKQLKRRLRLRGHVEKVDLAELLEVESDDEQDEEEEEDAEGEDEEQQDEEDDDDDGDDAHDGDETKTPTRKAKSSAQSESDDDDEEEEDLDADELAALREEAGGGDEQEGNDTGKDTPTTGGRGSRRAAAVAAAATEAGLAETEGEGADADADAMDTDE